jgi:hypothetical protein
MNHCEDCKFWNVSPDSVLWSWREKLNLDEYDDAKVLAALPHQIGTCECPGIPFYEFPAEGGATVVDGSTYRGDLITGPKFGCVLWQAADRGTKP